MPTIRLVLSLTALIAGIASLFVPRLAGHMLAAYAVAAGTLTVYLGTRPRTNTEDR